MRAWAIGITVATLLALPGIASAEETAAEYCGRRAMLPDRAACTEALSAIAERIRKSPNDPALYVERSALYQRLRDIDLAMADIDRAIKLKPSDKFYVIRSSLKGLVRNLDGAIEDANRALRLNPKNADAHRNLGYAYLIKKQTSRAIESFTRAIESDPNQARNFMARAGAYGNQGEKAKAEADCQRALALMPQRDGDMGYDGKGLTVRCHPELAKP